MFYNSFYGYGYPMVGGYSAGYSLGIILVLIAAVIAMIAQFRISSAYSKYSKQRIMCGRTGAMVAREILDSHGLNHISVVKVGGRLSDHYDPTAGVIRLSAEVYEGSSIASVAVAAHECGHALQYQQGYSPIKMRNAILPVANMGQYLGWFAIFIGFAFSMMNLVTIGIILMSGILAFQLVTLPVEFNASSRALTILEERYLTDDEYVGAHAVLNAAAMTYVAAMIQTLASILRLVLIVASNQRRD